MKKEERQNQASWRAFLGLIALALLGSLFAALWSASCGACDGAAAMLGGKALAWAGVAFYSIVLAAAILAGRSVFVFTSVMLAAGVHLGLMSLLLHTGTICAACFVTGGAAVAALILSVSLRPQNLARSLQLTPIAMIFVQVYLISFGAVPAATQARHDALTVIEAEEKSEPVAEGRVRMVIYHRPDCHFCRELEEDLLPVVQKEFAGVMDVERRDATRLPGIPTPTIILTGPRRRKLIAGLPRLQELRFAIREVMGGDDGETSLLSKP